MPNELIVDYFLGHSCFGNISAHERRTATPLNHQCGGSIHEARLGEYGLDFAELNAESGYLNLAIFASTELHEALVVENAQITGFVAAAKARNLLESCLGYLWCRCVTGS